MVASLRTHYYQPSHGVYDELLAAVRAAFAHVSCVTTCGSPWEGSPWWLEQHEDLPLLKSGRVIGQAQPLVAREPNRPLDPPSVAAAKDRWRLSFQRRVALADQVLAGADGDNAPTPSGAGDD